MQLFNLLAQQVTVYGQTFDVSLNWIGNLIRILITSVGSVGVGIILFSVILRLIVLPFDVYQRIAMRKQNNKMKENQARMEKLQQQYANNKELYNQKVMEMYKESGISLFSSCLPMIFSLVIFIVAINAFNAFSQYSNIQNYNTMVNAYNAKIEEYCPDLTVDNYDAVVSVDGEGKLVVSQDGKAIFYKLAKPEGFDDKTVEQKIAAIESVSAYSADGKVKTFYIKDGEELTNAQLVEQAQQAVKDAYDSQIASKTKFLWVKNIWTTDATYKHPVLQYADFKTGLQKEEFKVGGGKYDLNAITQYTNVYKEDAYNHITAKLDVEKTDTMNGYFIMIALSIGTILLQQFIAMRSSKEQQKYSTVDGQGASQQKTTMVVMTIMFAVFSFMYSAAFSIYLIMSNILSLISTVVINKCVDMREKKQNETVAVGVSGRYARIKGESKNEKTSKKK